MMTLAVLRAVGIAALVLFALNGAKAIAESEQGTLESFAELKPLISQMMENRGWQMGETLIVMDNDDTLSRMPCRVAAEGGKPTPKNCQYLGGAAWFSWQEDLMEHPDKKACKKDCVAQNFGELLDISAYLFAASNMEYAEPGQVASLVDLANAGARMMVLTARGGTNINATETQFGALGLPQGSSGTLLDLIRDNAPLFGAQSFSGAKPGLASPFYGCRGLANPVNFRNGVMYVSGQDKGKSLLCLLNQYNRLPGKAGGIQNVIFIDDTLSNVVKVREAFRLPGQYNVVALHYTYLAEHKALLTSEKAGKPFRAMATKRWKDLNTALDAALLCPILDASCSAN